MIPTAPLSPAPLDIPGDYASREAGEACFIPPVANGVMGRDDVAGLGAPISTARDALAAIPAKRGRFAR